jgi:hypothetical protein
VTIGHVSNITLHRVRRRVNPDLVLRAEWLLTDVSNRQRWSGCRASSIGIVTLVW